MITDDLIRICNKKVLEVEAEEAGGTYYVMFLTSHGLKFVLSSESPIYVEIETEQ